MVIPSGARLKTVTIGGVATTVLDFNKRRKGKRRVSKATKGKIAIARKRIKIPLLLVGAVAVGMGQPLRALMSGGGGIADRFNQFGKDVGQNYFGINPTSGKFDQAPKGTIALLVWGGLEGLGIVQRVNRKLGTANVPFVRL